MVLMNLEMLIEGGKIRARTSLIHHIGSASSTAILEIRETVAIIMEWYQRVHQVIQLAFSLVQHPLKISGDCSVVLIKD